MNLQVITGEKIQQLADIYIGTDDDFNYNPVIFNQSHKHCNIHRLTTAYDNPRIIFCYSHNINLFSEKIQFFNNKFVLLSHNSDENIIDTEQIQQILNCTNLLKWYAQNLHIVHPKLHYLPIGFANSMWKHGNLDFFKNDEIFDITKSKKIYFNFNVNTSYEKRISCYNSLKNKLPFLAFLQPNDNLSRLNEYEFCICPEGNGADTHRLWECLYLKVVPIVINSQFTKVLNKYNIPMVILEKWDDFDDTLLNYTDYNFSEMNICLSDFEKMIKNTV